MPARTRCFTERDFDGQSAEEERGRGEKYVIHHDREIRMAHARMRQMDQDLAGAWLGHVEGFELGAHFAGLVVHNGLVLRRDLDFGHCCCVTFVADISNFS